jgi:hypothetical protein
MPNITLRRPLLFCLTALACASGFFAIQMSHASQANAAIYGFCENVLLGGGGYCTTPNYVNLYQAYAWGDDHSVCVDVREWQVRHCSSGPEVGVYSGVVPAPYEAGIPIIENNAAGNNYVHGLYLTH